MTTDDYELLARHQGNDLSDEEAAALGERLAREPELRAALDDMKRLDELIAQLPRTQLVPHHVSALVSGALSARRQRLGFALASVAAAAAAALFLGWNLIVPSVEVRATSGMVVVDGRTLVAGERVTDPHIVITEEGNAVVRLSSARQALLGPRTRLEVGKEHLRLVRGAISAAGEGLFIQAGNHGFTIAGQAVLSTELFEADLRETPNLSPEFAVMNLKRLSAVSAVLTAVALYVFKGTVAIDSPGGARLVHAPEQWLSDINPFSAPQPQSLDAGIVASTLTSPKSEGVLSVHVTAAGKPVVGAQVRVYARGTLDLSALRPRWEPPVAGRTDRWGVSTLPVGPGSYAVSVHAQGWPASFQVAQRPSGEPITTLEVSLEPGSELAGVTRNARSGGPVTPATISVTALDAPEAEVITLDADENGRFRALNLAPGQWEVTGLAPGIGRAKARVRLPQVEPLKLHFQPVGFVDGFVHLPDGGPAVGALVVLVGEETATAECSASGSFAVEAPPGTWRAQARLGKLVGGTPGDFIVRPQATTSLGTLVLQAHSTLMGWVMAGDAGVEGAHVVISPHQGEGTVADVRTDASGRYDIPLLPGTYDVAAEGPGRAPAQVLGVNVARGLTRLDLQLGLNGSLRGEVVDGEGSLLKNHTVEVTRNGEERQSTLSTDGHFEFKNLAPGMWVCRVLRDAEDVGGATLRKVEAGQTAEVRLTVLPSVMLEGTLDWQCPGPRRATELSLLTRTPPIRRIDLKEPHFRIALAPDTYWVSVGTEDESCRASTQVTLKAGHAQSVHLVLKPREVSLKVTVLEPDGHPAARALVTFVDAKSPSTMLDLGETNEDGVLGKGTEWRDGKPTGAIQVVASKGGRTGRSGPIQLGDRTVPVTVTLLSAASLNLQLEGLPEGARATVELVAMPSFSFQDALVTLSANVQVDSVPPGRLHVTVRSDNRAGEAELVLKPGERVAAKIQLAEAGAVEGRLVTPDGKSRAGWVGLLTSTGEETSEAVHVDDTGHFEIRPVVPGTYQLRVMGEKDSIPVPVMVKAGETTHTGDIKPLVLPLPAQRGEGRGEGHSGKE